MRLAATCFGATLASLLAFAACGSDDAAAPSCTGVQLLVAGSDYNNASVVCGAPTCVENSHTTGKTLGSDPMLAGSNGKAFLLVRDDNALIELDPKCGTAVSLTSLYPLAGSPTGQTNPHGVAVAADGTQFVALYNVPKLAFVKNSAIEGSLDLSSYDADGNPQADSIAIVGDKAFVALERLDDKDDFKSKQTSQILRVDVATRKAEATIDLQGMNPFNAMAIAGTQLFLAEPGDPDSATDTRAGIEQFDTTTSTSTRLISESALGGSAVEVAVSGACGVAIVAGPVPKVNPTALVSFDPTTGEVLHAFSAPVLGPTPGYDLQGLAWRGSTLYVGDRTKANPTVHELALTGACELTETTTTIPLPLPPVALLPAATP